VKISTSLASKPSKMGGYVTFKLSNSIKITLKAFIYPAPLNFHTLYIFQMLNNQGKINTPSQLKPSKMQGCVTSKFQKKIQI
jgi:hypothetical protein